MFGESQTVSPPLFPWLMPFVTLLLLLQLSKSKTNRCYGPRELPSRRPGFVAKVGEICRRFPALHLQFTVLPTDSSPLR